MRRRDRDLLGMSLTTSAAPERRTRPKGPNFPPTHARRRGLVVATPMSSGPSGGVGGIMGIITGRWPNHRSEDARFVAEGDNVPRMARRLIVVVVSCTVACGGMTREPADASADHEAAWTLDALAADITSDAAPFPCGGDAMCDPSQICLLPPYDTNCSEVAPISPGVCPSGTEYFDATAGCIWIFGPCLSLLDASPILLDWTQIDCSYPDGAPGCDPVGAPTPSTCSRICRVICMRL